MYFDGEEDIRKVEKILEHIKGNGLIILADTNARNRLWHDMINNERGKTL
mgnify:CR=1 FL=1